MTPGHKHREFGLRHDSRLLRVLTVPLYTTTDYAKARDSKWPYGAATMQSKTWAITPLSVLHRFAGITVRIKP